MGKASDTLVFVPAWNEEQGLPAVLDELRHELGDVDVLVVDDGSTDRTAEVARAHGAEVLSFGENRGLRAAIAAGYGYAAEHGYAHCGRVDADGQHPVEELRRLLDLVRAGSTDVAVGSRFASGHGYAEDRYEPTAVRRFGIDLLQRSISTVLGRPWHDATSGMIAANARALPILARPYTSGAPEVEALIRLHDQGLRVEEVPVHMRERSSGESKLQGKKAVVLVADRDRDARHGRADASPAARKRWLTGGTDRVVAVLGYSSRRGDGLHPICAARLAHGERAAAGASAVVLSGWARRPHRRPEAELMRASWAGPDVPLHCDPDARTTADNAARVASAAIALGARELVVVTSSWHRRRAGILVRAALGTHPVRVTVEAPTTTRPPVLLARELACLALLPFQLRRARRGGATATV